jgi:pimeloyl-ACP methyl ester carboxylesterase
MRRSLQVLALLAVALLTACVAHGDPSKAIPVATIAAKQTATRVVIVLPGRADDLGRLRASGISDAIQGVWPDADVVFAEVTVDYYKQGDASRRLHDEVIAPARARGYREVWLAGASMGGMGTLLYDAQYPGELDGMILLAPYLGDYDLLLEIDQAGGVTRWDGGPSQGFTPRTWQRDLWRYLKALSNDPDRSERIWLAYGDDDRLRKAMPLLVPALHQQQVFERAGGHKWSVWTPATRDILQAIDKKAGTTAATQ